MGACERSKSALGVGHMGAGTTAPSCASRCVKQAVLRASSLPAWPSASSHAWVAPFAGGARPSSRKASASFSAASTGASKKGANTGPPLATNLATVASPTRLGEQTVQTGRFLADSANRETRSRAVRRGEARRRGEAAWAHMDDRLVSSRHQQGELGRRLQLQRVRICRFRGCTCRTRVDRLGRWDGRVRVLWVEHGKEDKVACGSQARKAARVGTCGGIATGSCVA